ncbi:MAG: zinc-dependent metalloprotease, partial [Pyrinomonadaceae bacterium]
LPEALLKLMPPRPPGYPRNREDFRIRTSPAFDALAPAEAYANHVCDFLLNAERAARLVEFHSRDMLNPGWNEVLDKILTETIKASARSGYEAEIQRTVNAVVLNELMALAANERASNQVRAIAEYQLDMLKAWLIDQRNLTRDQSRSAFLLYAANQIKRFQEDPKKMNLTKPNDPPDGQPIGTDVWATSERPWCDWR